MIGGWLKRIVNSVFTKLLALTIATVFVINLSVFGLFLIYKHFSKQPFRRNVSQYLGYIIDDIGNPPNRAKADEITEKTGIQIYYSGEQSWTTSPDRDFNTIKFGRNKTQSKMQFSDRNEGFSVKYTLPEGYYIFDFTDDPEDEQLEFVTHLLFYLVIALILSGTYLFTRRILKPILQLTEGVEQVSHGNLSHSIPVKCEDELGQLAMSFNNMTNNLRDIMHTKERLLLDISHELRSPLTRMKVSLEFLPGQHRESLQDDIQDMEDMITTILETAKTHHHHSKPAMKEVELVAMLEKIVQQFKNAVLIIKTPSPELHCIFDPDQLRTVLQNVIENGIKYSEQAEEPITITLFQGRNGIAIEIKDKGVGINSDDLPFLFEPFYRVDRSRSKGTGGYGLGLSLCKTIMEAHGGTITIKSDTDIGTTVKLYIPNGG